MKKIYSLALAALMGLSAMAQGSFTLPLTKQQMTAEPRVSSLNLPQNGAMTVMNAPAQAGEMLSLDLGYCGNIYTAYKINTGETGIAVAFPASMLAGMVGNQITAINVASPVNTKKSNLNTGNYVNTLTTCKVAVTESLGGDPVVETEATISDKGLAWNTVKLETPYTIVKGKSVYISVQFHGITTDDFPIVVDNNSPANNYAFYLYSRYQAVNNQGEIVLQDNYQWKPFGNIVGCNACLTCTVEGTTLPTNQGYVVLDDAEMAIKPGKPFKYLAAIYNEGANEIKNVELTMNIPGQEPQSKTVNVVPFYQEQTTINFHQYCIAQTEFTCDKEGYFDYTVAVTKVNGVPNELAEELFEGSRLCLEKGYPVVPVCEELTSTQCAYCPIGIVGLEQMRAKYGNDGRFIPIAVHANIPSPTDPMNVCAQSGPYYEFMTKTGGSAPSSYFMRDFSNTVYPAPDYLEETIQQYLSALSPFDITAYINKTDKDDEVELTIDMTSSLSLSNSYGFVYTIIEDDLGPYTQQNGYSGTTMNCYGWEKKPKTVSTKYNDVARKGSLYKPAADAVLESIEKDTKYSHTYKVNLSSVTNLANYSIAAMLVDTKTGKIMNACRVYSPDNTGVEGITSESVKAVAYGMQGAVDMVYAGDIYTVDGRMVAKNVQGAVAMPAGIYVVTTANGTAKVVVR